MSKDTQLSGEIEYPEGFRLNWNCRGLEITVTEYHPGTLKLAWSTLLELASKAVAEGECPSPS